MDTSTNSATTTRALPSTRPMTNIRHCGHCGLPYDWRRSPSSSLKMTYCGSLCEKADLGFTIEALLGEVEYVKPAWRVLLAA